VETIYAIRYSTWIAIARNDSSKGVIRYTMQTRMHNANRKQRGLNNLIAVVIPEDADAFSSDVTTAPCLVFSVTSYSELRIAITC
jgi:hypothetical protein